MTCSFKLLRSKLVWISPYKVTYLFIGLSSVSNVHQVHRTNKLQFARQYLSVSRETGIIYSPGLSQSQEKCPYLTLFQFTPELVPT